MLHIPELFAHFKCNLLPGTWLAQREVAGSTQLR